MTRRSPAKFYQNCDLDSPKSRQTPYASPESVKNSWKIEENQANMIPVYTADPLLLKQYEINQAKLQDQLIKSKEKYEEAIRGKNEEIKRAFKLNENLKQANSFSKN